MTTCWRDDELVEVIARVARHVRPRRPDAVTMEAWDAGRADALGTTDAAELPPSARGILMRLNSRGGRGRNWRQWLALALTTEDNAPSVERHLTGQRAAPPSKLSENRVRYALRTVAEHLEVDALSPDDYARGRVSLLGTDRRRRTGVPGSLVELLPTVDQLQYQWKWNAALAVAGLKRPAVLVTRRSVAVHPGGLPHVEAQVVFARHNQRFASQKELQRFMLDCDAALADKPAGGEYERIYTEARARLRTEGVTVRLSRPKTGARRMPYKLPPGGCIPGAPPSLKRALAESTAEQRREALHQRCIAGLQAFDAWLAVEHPGVTATQERYRIWCKGAEWPAASNFQNFGGFTVLLRAARAGRKP